MNQKWLTLNRVNGAGGLKPFMISSLKPHMGVVRNVTTLQFKADKSKAIHF